MNTQTMNKQTINKQIMSAAAAAKARHARTSGVEAMDAVETIVSGARALKASMGSHEKAMHAARQDKVTAIRSLVVTADGLERMCVGSAIEKDKSLTVQLGISDRELPQQKKRKARLLEKAESRPAEAVARIVPIGMMQARKAPKLSDFNEPGVSFEEKKRRHAEAMHAWIVKNVSKTGIQKGTQARKHRILNAERERERLYMRTNMLTNC